MVLFDVTIVTYLKPVCNSYQVEQWSFLDFDNVAEEDSR